MPLAPRVVLCATLLFALPHAAAAQCGGVERWPVKVGSDNAASAISTTPVLTLLHDLISLPRPSLPSDDFTRTAAEREVRTVEGRLRKFKLESGRSGDQDYHLVITVQTFNLTAFKGKTIRLELVGQEDNGSMTSFVVDDFRLLIEQ